MKYIMIMMKLVVVAGFLISSIAGFDFLYGFISISDWLQSAPLVQVICFILLPLILFVYLSDILTVFMKNKKFGMITESVTGLLILIVTVLLFAPASVFNNSDQFMITPGSVWFIPGIISAVLLFLGHKFNMSAD